jgi:hypothetical protein
MALLGEARAAMAGMSATHELAETEAAMAECLLLRGDFKAALDLAGEAMGRARQAGAARALPALERIRGFALLRTGSVAESRKVFEDVCRLTSEPGTQHEHAFALAGLAEVSRLAGDIERAEALHAESRELLDRLGVVSIPAPL